MNSSEAQGAPAHPRCPHSRSAIVGLDHGSRSRGGAAFRNTVLNPSMREWDQQSRAEDDDHDRDQDEVRHRHVEDRSVQKATWSAEIDRPGRQPGHGVDTRHQCSSEKRRSRFRVGNADGNDATDNGSNPGYSSWPSETLTSILNRAASADSQAAVDYGATVHCGHRPAATTGAREPKWLRW